MHGLLMGLHASLSGQQTNLEIDHAYWPHGYAEGKVSTHYKSDSELSGVIRFIQIVYKNLWNGNF